MPERVQALPRRDPHLARHRAPQMAERAACDRVPVEREHEVIGSCRRLVPAVVHLQRRHHDRRDRHDTLARGSLWSAKRRRLAYDGHELAVHHELAPHEVDPIPRKPEQLPLPCQLRQSSN